MMGLLRAAFRLLEFPDNSTTLLAEVAAVHGPVIQPYRLIFPQDLTADYVRVYEELSGK